MRVAVLGGAGQMGSRTVEDLVGRSEVTALTVLDRDVAAARRLVARLAPEDDRVQAVGVDATRDHALTAALAGHDVVASALGPFYRFELPAARAALAVGADYVSLCDDWQPAAELLDTFDAEARRRGVRLVTGVGASPGVTNVGVRLLADEVDAVERVRVAVYEPLDAGGGPAVLDHVLHVMQGPVAVVREGARTTVRACSHAEDVDFPGVGRQRMWSMGHAEPVTLPRALPGVRRVDFVMGYGRGAAILVTPSRWGAFDGPWRRRLARWCLGAAEAVIRPREAGLGAVRVDVWGHRAGVPTHGIVCGTGRMREVTGDALAVGACLLGRGEVVCGPGAWGPEQAFDPRVFLDAMRARGLEAWRDVDGTRPA